MDPTQTAALTAVITSMLLQTVKDHVNINQAYLRWLGAILGGIAAGITSYGSGATASGDLATNIGIGAVLTSGTHSLFLQDSLPGRILKAIGTTIFEKPTTPQG